MSIVELPPTRYAEAVALWETVGLTRPWNDALADIERAARGPGSLVLAYVDGDHLVGTAMVGHDGHRGWVYYLATAPDRRREGIGKELMFACESWLESQGIPAIRLMVRSDNAGVVDFYDAIGYEELDVLVLGRRLDEPRRTDGE